MSLTEKLKPQVSKIKVTGIAVNRMSKTERRLNFMTAIILNPNLTKAEKDSRLKKIVADSQIEKALKDRGVKV